MHLITFRRIAHRIASEDREARLVAARSDPPTTESTNEGRQSLATYRAGVARVTGGPTRPIAPFLLRSRATGA